VSHSLSPFRNKSQFRSEKLLGIFPRALACACRVKLMRLAGLLLVVGLTADLALHAQAEGARGNTIIPVDAERCRSMETHHVLGPHPPVACDRLRVVKFGYVDFHGKLQTDGEIVVMDAAAKHVLRIFETLRRARFPIAKANVLDRYDGDDLASMNDNNTSAFNDRPITGGGLPSLHAYGLAIDIDPIQNPYVTRSGATFTFEPAAGADYANRLENRPGKQARQGMAEAVIEVFAENGFLIWGGYWDSPIDYQHFQVGRPFAERLTQLNGPEAEQVFDDLVKRYRHCRHASGSARRHDRTTCIVRADHTAVQP
jgi:hypothetical protein